MQELDYTNNPYQDESEQLYQYYLRAAQDRLPEGDDRGAYIEALDSVIKDREGAPIGGIPLSGFNADTPVGKFMQQVLGWDAANQRPPNRNPALRNVDHGLQSQKDSYERSALARFLRPFGYNAAKLIAQRGPTSLAKQLEQSIGLDLVDASPPSWDSIKWGLRSFWGRN